MIAVQNVASDTTGQELALGRVLTVIACATVFFATYAFSTWLLDIYRAGDQKYYADFWNSMTWAHPSQWSRLQYEYLNSAEPLYRYIIGLGTYYGFERIKYLSFCNGILTTAVTYILIKFRSSLLFSFFVFSNYYLIVLLGPAERLKFAYLMLILAFCAGGSKWKGTLSLMSVFTHTQAAVQFISSAMYYTIEKRQEIFSSRARSAMFIVSVPIAGAIIAYFFVNSVGEVVSRKAEYYGDQSQGLLEIVQWVLILICGTIVFDKKLQFFVAMLPMGVLTALYGNRINVATLALFCALALTQRKTAHPLVLAVMGYMSFKTIGFISNVLATGQGF